MLLHLGRSAGRRPRLVILMAALLVVVSAIYSLDVMQRLTLSPGWEVPGSGSTESANVLREHLGRDDTPVILLFRPAGKLDQVPGPLVDTPAYRDAVEQVLVRIGTNPDVSSIASYPMTGDARLRTEDGRLSYAIVQLDRSNNEGVEAFLRLRQQVKSDELEVLLGGELATYVDIREQLEKDIWRAEVVSFIALAFLLIWVFGSATAAMLPLLVGGFTIILSVTLLKLFTLFMDISVYAANVVSMLGLGHRLRSVHRLPLPRGTGEQRWRCAVQPGRHPGHGGPHRGLQRPYGGVQPVLSAHVAPALLPEHGLSGGYFRGRRHAYLHPHPARPAGPVGTAGKQPGPTGAGPTHRPSR